MSIEEQFKAIPSEVLHKLIKDLNEYYVDDVEILNSEGCLHCKGGFQINTSDYEPTVTVESGKLNIIGCGTSVKIKYCPMCGSSLK